MSFKAKIQRLASASSADVCKLIQWLNISKSNVETDNPNLAFATVTNHRNEIVGCVPFERVFIVKTDAVAQNTTEANDLPIGNVAAGAIESEARAEGVSKVLMILADHHPQFPHERWMRVVEQPVAQAAPMPKVNRYLQPSVIFIN